MTTSLQLREVQPSWTIERLREEAAKMMAAKVAARLRFMEETDPRLIERYIRISAQLKAAHFKDKGIRNPHDLVNMLAEHEANLFGSRVQIAGDERSAVLYKKEPKVWTELKKHTQLTSQQEQYLQQQFKLWLEELGESFGFSVHVEIPDSTSAKITFSRA